MPWVNHPRPVSKLKRIVLKGGRRTRIVKSGAFKGIVMDIDFDHETQLFLGLHEREVQRWLVEHSSQCLGAIDIGAGEGEYTLFFLSKTRASRVWAFEPLNERRDYLVRNLQLNGLAKDARLTLSSQFVGSVAGSQITLDALATQLPRPCFIKVDVDGGEVEVLRGASELLRRGGVDWLIETHSRELEQKCQTILGSAGYSSRVIQNAWWRVAVPEMRPIAHNRWLVATRPD